MLLLDRRGSVGGWKCVLRRSSQGEVLLRHGPLDKRASSSRVTYPSLLPQKQPNSPEGKSLLRHTKESSRRARGGSLYVLLYRIDANERAV